MLKAVWGGSDASQDLVRNDWLRCQRHNPGLRVRAFAQALRDGVLQQVSLRVTMPTRHETPIVRDVRSRRPPPLESIFDTSADVRGIRVLFCPQALD